MKFNPRSLLVSQGTAAAPFACILPEDGWYEDIRLGRFPLFWWTDAFVNIQEYFSVGSIEAGGVVPNGFKKMCMNSASVSVSESKVIIG